MRDVVVCTLEQRSEIKIKATVSHRPGGKSNSTHTIVDERKAQKHRKYDALQFNKSMCQLKTQECQVNKKWILFLSGFISSLPQLAWEKKAMLLLLL